MKFYTDDGSEILTAMVRHTCVECTFRIEQGDPVVMHKWGWVHPNCLVGASE